MNIRRVSLFAGMAILSPALADPALADNQSRQFQVAQATSGVDPSLLDANGKPLTGDALKRAQDALRAKRNGGAQPGGTSQPGGTTQPGGAGKSGGSNKSGNTTPGTLPNTTPTTPSTGNTNKPAITTPSTTPTTPSTGTTTKPTITIPSTTPTTPSTGNGGNPTFTKPSTTLTTPSTGTTTKPTIPSTTPTTPSTGNGGNLTITKPTVTTPTTPTFGSGKNGPGQQNSNNGNKNFNSNGSITNNGSKNFNPSPLDTHTSGNNANPLPPPVQQQRVFPGFKAIVPSIAATLPGILQSDEIKRGRQEHRGPNGQLVIQEPGNRTIVQQDGHAAIQHDEAMRFTRLGNAQVEHRGNGLTETSYVRADGVRVFSQSDSQGRLVYVYRRGPDGRDQPIIDNRRFYEGAAFGAAIGLGIALGLAEPEIRIPCDRYIVDYRRASDDDLYEALTARPVEHIERAYSLDEIRYNVALRDRMRRIDLDDVTFSTGEARIDPNEYDKLERLAHVMQRILDRNPQEVFLIEGYTDAVGRWLDNLSLSDRRAETVAQVLTETFGIAPENMVTQGYGEQFLKIETQGPERANRRVAIRRITPLLTAQRW